MKVNLQFCCHASI